MQKHDLRRVFAYFYNLLSNILFNFEDKSKYAG